MSEPIHTLPLTQSYATRYGVPVVDRVDPRIFSLTYFAECMSCTFCHDSCCQYGADIELDRVQALEQYRPELEAYLGVPRAEWFREDPEDVGYLPEAEYPGGQYTRTNVVDLPTGRSPHTEWACVFLDPQGRGCRIHRFALERGIDVHTIKPMVCLLFPVSFELGLLKPAYEFDVDDLICQGPGPTLYQAARSDVEYYFGPELVAELDRMQAEHPPMAASRGVPLPTV
jgi:Fe-S-cluster containining protein